MSEQNATTNGLFATLQARDADAMLRFLTSLGFIENLVVRDGDLVAHAQLDWPAGGGVMLGSHRPDNELVQAPGTGGAYLVTDDVEAAHDRATAAGADSLRPPEDTPYGSRECTVRDPEGNLWSLGSYPGESRKG